MVKICHCNKAILRSSFKTSKKFLMMRKENLTQTPNTVFQPFYTECLSGMHNIVCKKTMEKTDICISRPMNKSVRCKSESEEVMLFTTEPTVQSALWWLQWGESGTSWVGATPGRRRCAWGRTCLTLSTVEIKDNMQTKLRGFPVKRCAFTHQCGKNVHKVMGQVFLCNTTFNKNV